MSTVSIVLNEYEWAEEKLRSHELGQRPYETLVRISKYYFAAGYTQREVRRLLEEFLLRCDRHINLFEWDDTLVKVLKAGRKHKLIQIDGVYITQPELDRIAKVSSVRARRLAFTLLCVSKYWDAVNPNNDHWVRTNDRELVGMANISASTKQQCMVFNELWTGDMIQFSRKVDNLDVRVLFQEDGENVALISDFRNLGYRYLMITGGPFFLCESCGLVTKKKGNKLGRPQKYCPACASSIKTRQNVEAVMRWREGLQTKQEI